MSNVIRACALGTSLLALLSACEPHAPIRAPEPDPPTVVTRAEPQGRSGPPAEGAAAELADPTAESIDGIGNGEIAAKVEARWGPPSERGEVQEWAATGDRVSTWVWRELGLSLDMAQQEGGTYSVLSISVAPPATVTTSRGIGIGSTYQQVEGAYEEFRGQGREEGEPEQWDREQIIVGSIFGGTFFKFEDGKVVRIFVGAGAE